MRHTRRQVERRTTVITGVEKTNNGITSGGEHEYCARGACLGLSIIGLWWRFLRHVLLRISRPVASDLNFSRVRLWTMNDERVAAAARAAHRMIGLVHRLLLDWLSSLHSACLLPLQATRVADALSHSSLSCHHRRALLRHRRDAFGRAILLKL